MVLSLLGLKFSNQHLELDVHPRELHRFKLFYVCTICTVFPIKLLHQKPIRMTTKSIYRVTQKGYNFSDDLNFILKIV